MHTDTPQDQLTGLEIAIVGIAGRFPGAGDVDAFWHNLYDGVEAVSFLSDEALIANGVDAEMLNHPNYVKAAAILDDVESFDAGFFGITAREAELMDPQQRLFLECAWETLENAGCDPETYPGAIGLYGGAHISTYLLSHLAAHDPEAANAFQTMLCNDKDFLTTRVSYKLNLTGPSINVNTACSTSLVAVHLACQDLLSGACDLALAGGVTVIVPQKMGYFYQEGGITSADGHCRAFDARAQGTITGNGVGLVALKRLEDALADGDHVWAVIKGSAVNNDGGMKVGYTAPSVDGQAKVIRAALMMAEVDPATISYVEAHGTGTPLGDPIEIAALTKAYRAWTEERGFCAIGSVKTNVGHLDAAAGVTGLIKTILALKHGWIPPSLHFERPNPKINFQDSPFYVNARLTEWQTNGGPRRAGVSSFGLGGTNAHVILESAPPTSPPDASRPWQLLLLSAKSDAALAAAAENLGGYLAAHPDVPLADVAYTLQVGRQAFEHRCFVVCQEPAEAVEILAAMADPADAPNLRPVDGRPVVFMFSGQGAQHIDMGRELYATEPVFRETVDRCANALQPHLGLDLREVMYPGPHQSREDAAQQLKQTALTQPALFTIEYALAKLWMAWGVQPRAMIGHSIGEYTAACLAGVFGLDEALALVAARGRLLQDLPGGSMLAVAFSEAEIAPYLAPPLALAVVNAPTQCVISGPNEAIDALADRLAAEEVACRRLRTSHAFHSPMMAPAMGPFTELVSSMRLSPPRIPYVSNVTGTWATATQATDPDYWARHLRQTVRFADGLRTLAEEPQRILLEVGPGQTLCALARRQPDASRAELALSTLPHARDEQSAMGFVLKTLGRLWSAGLAIDWPRFYVNERQQRVPLPTYPFERRRYWVEPRDDRDTGEKPAAKTAPLARAETGRARPVASPSQVRVIEQQLELMARQLHVVAAAMQSEN